MPLSAGDAFLRILVAVDDSSHALDVVAAAVELARSSGASMRLFHALSIPPEFPPAAHVAVDDPLPRYLHDETLRRLEALKGAVGNVPCDVHVEESESPWRAILAAADQFAADLIVLGSHRYTLLDRVLGTTAAKVVDHAKRTVFVVHPRSI